MSTILVTGSSGHLGANLVRRLIADRSAKLANAARSIRVLLRQGSDNTALDGLDVERVYGDLRDPAAVRAAVDGCSQIYHCAARVSTVGGSERDIYDCNVTGTRHLLRAAKDAKVERVVVTSSFSAVGHPHGRPATEDDAFYPFEHHMPYERSKAWMEHECLLAVRDGLDVVIATSCAILGPADFKPSRMGRVLVDFANGEMRAYIPGGFEFVSAADLCEGHLLAMQKGRTGHKYIFSTQFVTVDELMALMEDVTGRPKPRLRLPAPVMLAIASVVSPVLTRFFPSVPQRLTPGAVRILSMQRRADTSKAREELGYRPTSVRQALADAYAFHCERGAIREPRVLPQPAAAHEGAHAGRNGASSRPTSPEAPSPMAA